MPYNILKLTDENNRTALFCLATPEGHYFEFTYKTLRPVLLDAGFSSHACGSILHLLRKSFPIDNFGYASVPHPSDYGLGTLIDYMKDRGFKVYIPLPLRDVDITEHLNSKGYLVIPPEKNQSLPLAYENEIDKE